MHRLATASLFALLAMLSLATASTPAEAQVKVNRLGTENPAVEVFRSTLYGGLAGATVGLAIVAMDEGADADAVLRNSFGVGTFLGLAMGIAFVTTRPRPTGMIEFQDGEAHLAMAAPEFRPDGEVRVRLIGARF